MVPFHPITVHFPVALLVVACVFSLLAFFIKSEGVIFKHIFKWSLYIGTIGSVIASISGIYAEKSIEKNAIIQEYIGLHNSLGLIITGMAILLSFWLAIRKSNLKGFEVKTIIIILIALVSLLVYSSYLGSKLVYEQGVGINPNPKKVEIKEDKCDEKTHKDKPCFYD